MHSNSLQKLYIDELKALHNAELQVLRAIPKLAMAASDETLRETLAHQGHQAQEHIACIERLLGELDETPKGRKSAAMEGMLKDSVAMMKDKRDSSALDAALIAHAQDIEHFQIAKYGTVRAWARRLGYDNQARKLEDCLREETEADRALTQIAESAVNLRAAAQPA